MSDLLSIGASGARAAQVSLTTVSENIANSGVAGYSRRVAANQEVATTGIRGRNGYGVRVTTIDRATDIFKTQAVRTAGTDLARTTTAATWLTGVQSALGAADVKTRVTDVFNQATKLAADPGSTTQRTAMLEIATAAAAAFSATGDALAQVTADLDTAADAATAKLTSLSQGLAKVNAGLGRAVPGSAGAAGLLDERDRLLEEMSGIADVSTAFDRFGRVTARVGGAGGPALVEGEKAGEVGYARNAQGAVSFVVTREFVPSVFVPTGGSLAGIADAAAKVADARDALDDVARDFADGMNAAQAGGYDTAGVAGTDMFAYDADEPSQMTMVLTTPAGIAAAGLTGGPRDGSNLPAFQATRTAGGYESKLTALVSSNAAAIESRATVAAAQGAILDGAVAARDSATGVNLDNEAVDLLRFQQAFQASSRVIQAARDIFQSILEVR
ncbi:flagellar biosynthesis protein FlgK [Sphingomonas sp. Leaf412]|uniref:flagellar hook-associated protein FlgK n=1 Tax=Sphingomonas sp. Leaf412 TaxID=1736370 RepID=UPI0006F5C2A7|nr:flagellar hook-associated protein FlgK [Sphingomonas sp. Leaf412]KQT35140.1 flagellar biosynthesis protein FlgK [Sphingomonas sp. Leaf412]